jgi:ribonucleoside-diphosphate reductase alpha chain
MAATHVEKSTVAHGALNAVPTGGSNGGAAGGAGFGAAGGAAGNGGSTVMQSAPEQAVEAAPEAEGPVCMMRPGDAGFEECEACQ